MTTESGPAGGADVPRDPAHRNGGTLWTPPEYRNSAATTTSPVPAYLLQVLPPHYTLVRTEHPTPPGALYALLSLSYGGLWLFFFFLCTLLLGTLRRFLGLPECLQLRLKRSSPLLCYLPADTFGSELLTNLSQFAHKWP